MQLPNSWVEAVRRGAVSSSKRLRDGLMLEDVIGDATLELLERAAQWPKGAADYYATHGEGHAANFARLVARREGTRFDRRRAGADDLVAATAPQRVSADLRRDVADALDVLDERTRWLVTGWYWRNQTAAEMGAALGVSATRVSQIVRAGLARLRERLWSYAEEYDRGPRAARQAKTGTKGTRSRADYS